jgi:tetratricopeptide (TPR) repeat protein
VVVAEAAGALPRPGVGHWLQRLAALRAAGRHDEAVAVCDEVLRADPGDFDALNNRGVALAGLGRMHEALAGFEHALAVRPSAPEAWNNRGLSLTKIGRHEDALASFQRAVELRPGYVEALANAGELLAKLGRLDTALQVYDELSRAAPDAPDVLLRQGNLLTAMGRIEDALSCYDRILAIDPGHPDAMNNRGTMLDKLSRPEEALACYDRAITLRPMFLAAMRNRAIVLGRLRRFEEAFACFAEIRMIQPEFPDAHAHEALLRLRLGDYRVGFRQFEWRWLDRSVGPSRRDFRRPLWTGRDRLEGRTILVHAEQGLGDMIQFVRYVPMLADRGAAVTLEVPQVLIPLMKGLRGVSAIVPFGEPEPATDFQIPLLSLPCAFGTELSTVPASPGYLTVEPATAAGWRAKFRHGRERLVGVCWRGNPEYPSDRDRSIRFADFAPLLTVPGIRFVSLQKDLTEEERHLAAALPLVQPGLDFTSTAELVGGLDLIMTVDTAWSHWAGAIGKPAWVLLSHAPHWAWLLDREDSPWYPSARLFRQTSPGDWKGAIRSVREALAAPASARRGRTPS